MISLPGNFHGVRGCGGVDAGLRHFSRRAVRREHCPCAGQQPWRRRSGRPRRSGRSGPGPGHKARAERPPRMARPARACPATSSRKTRVRATRPRGRNMAAARRQRASPLAPAPRRATFRRSLGHPARRERRADPQCRWLRAAHRQGRQPDPARCRRRAARREPGAGSRTRPHQCRPFSDQDAGQEPRGGDQRDQRCGLRLAGRFGPPCRDHRRRCQDDRFAHSKTWRSTRR